MLGRRVINSSRNYQTTGGIDQTAETIGDRIRRFRKEREWSQIYLGFEVGVTAATISKYEKDKLKIDVETADRLADIFHVTLDKLVHGDEPTKKSKFYNECDELRAIIKDEVDQVNDKEDLREIKQEIDKRLAKHKKHKQ